MPSFSVTLTRCFPGQEPMDVLALQDWRPVNRRELHLDLHPRDSDPSVETVNAQFAGSIGYGAEYLQAKVTNHHAPSGSTASSPSASSSSSSDEDRGAAISSASATLAEWNDELDSGDETATLSDCDASQFDHYNLPLHRQGTFLNSVTQTPSLPPRLRKFSMNAGVSFTPPSTLSSSPMDEHEDNIVSLASTTEQDLNWEFESARSSDPENTTASDGAVEGSSGPVPPFHRQLASSNPLSRTPPLHHPHYHNDMVRIHVLDTRGRQVSSEGTGSIRRRPPVRGLSPLSRFPGWSLLLSASTIFRSLWRKLKRVGGLVLRGFTKDM